MRFSKKIDRRRPTVEKGVFFRLFANILEYFPIEIVFKIVQNGISNIQDQKLPAAIRFYVRRPARRPRGTLRHTKILR